MRAEQEMALKLLEKDVHEKQDTIISLREQLDDIKHINLEMYTKLQVSSDTDLLLAFSKTRFYQNGIINMLPRGQVCKLFRYKTLKTYFV